MTIIEQRASDVRINEYDVSQVITSSSSSRAAQVIVSKKGRADEPQHWTQASAYMNGYGKPDASVSFDVYCGLNFFSEGNNLWGIRALGIGALYSSVLMYENADKTTGLLPIAAGVVDPELADLDALAPPGAVALALFYPNTGQGSHGDQLAIGLDSPNVKQVTGQAAQATMDEGILGPGTYQYQISAVGDSGESLASSTVSVVIAGGTPSNHAIDFTWPAQNNAKGYRVYGRVAGAGYGLIATVGQVNGQTVTFTDTGAIPPDTAEQPILDPADVAVGLPTFTVNVYDLERSSSVPMEPFVCTLLDGTDGDGLNTELEERINPFSQYILVRSNMMALPNPEIVHVTDVPVTAMAGGDSGTAPTQFDVAAAWDVFKNRQKYEINLLINSGHSSPEVGHAMEQLARRRGDALALLDTPTTKQQYMQAINYRNLELNINSSYASLFCPDVMIADTVNGKQQYVPFSGFAAALCARTARVANASYSPAGLNRGLVGVLRSRYTYDDEQASMLFRAQVNYTREFPGEGIALWEQQTMQSRTSALSWMSVRILTNIIKVSLYKYGLWIIQEPNNDPTGLRLRTSFENYLDGWVDAEGLNSYSVISDASNNSAAFYESGIRKVTVLLYPTIPIHELQIDAVISKAGVSFSETMRMVYGGAAA